MKVIKDIQKVSYEFLKVVLGHSEFVIDEGILQSSSHGIFGLKLCPHICTLSNLFNRPKTKNFMCALQYCMSCVLCFPLKDILVDCLSYLPIISC